MNKATSFNGSGRAAAILALLIVTLSALVLNQVSAAAMPAPPHQGATPGPSPTSVPACAIQVNKVAAPEHLRLGGTADVTLTVQPVCRPPDPPLHVALALDASSMPGRLGSEMAQAAVDLVDRLDLPNHSQRQVGVVEFAEEATTLCGLTNDSGLVRNCVNRVGHTGLADPAQGLQEALAALRRGRHAPSNELREVIVLFSGGGSPSGCPPVLRAASAAKSDGILLVSQCVGSDCAAACIRQAATSSQYYFAWHDKSSLLDLLDRIAEAEPQPVRLVVTDTLPANMRLVDANPPPTVSGPDLSWSFGPDFSTRTYTMTLRVEPLEVGDLPTNVSAEGRLTFGADVWSFAFPVPRVVVSAVDTPTPKPTNPPDTPTLTEIPPTPTRTPLPGYPAYLPALGTG
jgi:hypothetical protein